MGHNLYLFILLGSIAFPFAFSFDKRLQFFRKWKYMTLSILLPAVFFVAWDWLFTYLGVWSFNPDYILGKYLLNLPVEEVAFFFIIPYCCLFVYENMKYFFPNDPLKSVQNMIAWSLIFLCAILVFKFNRQLYTSTSSLFLLTALLLHRLVFKSTYLGMFFLSYGFTLIPFFIVNGLLTSFPVVKYNDMQNVGIRLGTIPVEDLIYNMVLLLMNIGLYEFFQRKYHKKVAKD